MRLLTKNKASCRKTGSKQRGVVLFIALIALVALSLAGVALVRSVDTSTIIAGNLAFKQAATSSGDSGIEGAIGWLRVTGLSNTAKDPWTDLTHAFNNNNVAAGYYSSVATPVNLMAATTWAAGTSAPGTGAGFDGNGLDANTGNTVRYVIQRMCRVSNTVLTQANCLFSDASNDNTSKRVKDSNQAGAGAGTGGSPLYRITARVTGPKNTVSYVQAFAY